MRYFFAFLLCLMHISLVEASGVITIKGVYPGGAGEEVRLMREVDLLSNVSQELDATHIGPGGHFSFTIHAEGPARYHFRIGHSRNHFIACAGDILEVELSGPEPGDHDGGPAFMRLRQNLNMRISQLNHEQYDLNQLELDLITMLSDFLQEEVLPRIHASHQSALRSLKTHLDSAFQHVTHDFFVESLRYQVAYLEHGLSALSDRRLFEEYLVNQPILYDHPHYMLFFAELVQSHVFASSRMIRLRDLQHAVNVERSHASLAYILAQDAAFASEDLRELAMIRVLQSMLLRDDFSPEAVLSVLDHLGRDALIRKHRGMAASVIQDFKRLRPGSPAPPVVLDDRQGNARSLEEFRGSYVYLFFGAGWCPVSMSELSPMKDMPKAVDGPLVVMGILLDKEGQEAGSLPVEPRDNFILLSFGGNYRLTDAYRIRSTPQYFLIDPQGRILDRDFSPPSAGAAHKIQRIIDG